MIQPRSSPILSLCIPSGLFKCCSDQNTIFASKGFLRLQACRCCLHQESPRVSVLMQISMFTPPGPFYPRDGQAMMFMAGANSIFTGDRLLTTSNPEFDSDKVRWCRNLGVSRLLMNVIGFARRLCCLVASAYVYVLFMVCTSTCSLVLE